MSRYSGYDSMQRMDDREGWCVRCGEKLPRLQSHLVRVHRDAFREYLETAKQRLWQLETKEREL